MVSYGAWNMLAALLGAREFLRLQALCKYAYDTSISRSLPAIYIDEPVCVMTVVYNEFTNESKLLTYDGTKCREFTNKLIELD